jgi:hypothetical protein
MRVVRNVAGAVVVIGIGAGLWAAGQLQSRHATARRAFLMMRYAAPIEEYDAVEPAARFLPATWRADLQTRRAESQYWLHQYSSLARPSDHERGDDADVPGAAHLMVIANAAYREIAGTLNEALKGNEARLEGVARLYLDVLERDPERIDAAFNYEFIIRRRNALTRDPAAKRRPDAPQAGAHAESTLHGTPGAAPAQTNMGDFKIIVPQRPEERRAQPDAGSGAAKARKG